MWTHHGCSVILTLLVLTFFTKSAYLALNLRLIPHDCRLSVRFPNIVRGKNTNRRSATLKATQLQYCRAPLCTPLMSEIEQPINVNPSNAADRIITMYQFARPHTIHGTILASVVVVLRALSELRILPTLVEGGRLSILFRFLPNFLGEVVFKICNAKRCHRHLFYKRMADNQTYCNSVQPSKQFYYTNCPYHPPYAAVACPFISGYLISPTGKCVHCRY